MNLCSPILTFHMQPNVVNIPYEYTASAFLIFLVENYAHVRSISTVRQPWSFHASYWWVISGWYRGWLAVLNTGDSDYPIVSLTRKDLAFEFVTNCHQLTFNVTVSNTHLILLTVGHYLYLNLTHNPPCVNPNWTEIGLMIINQVLMDGPFMDQCRDDVVVSSK